MRLYKGGIGQASWALHRLTGIGVLLFLFTHIADTALVKAGPEWYNKIIAIYRIPLFGISEIFLFAAVLFHALNGLRIVIIDFWPESTVYHKLLFKGMMGIFLAVFLPVGWIMLGHALHGGAH